MSEQLPAAPRHTRVGRACGLLWTVLLVVTGCSGARTASTPSPSQVKNAEGHPIPGARVRCERLLYQQPPEACGEAVTDDEGRYRLAALKNPLAGMTLLIEAEGYAPRIRQLPCERPIGNSPMPSDELVKKMAPNFGATQRTLGDFTLQRAAPLTGEVVDEQGHPVVGAMLRVFSLQPPGKWALCEQEKPMELRSGEAGRFRFDAVTVGAASLSVLAPDFQPTRADVEVPREPLRLTLRTGGFISGHVRDTLGNPIGHARVQLMWPEPDRPSFPLKEVHTSEDGAFHISHVADGRYALEVLDQQVLGHGWHREFARIEVREGRAELEPIVFIGRSSLAGQVVDDEGRAVAGAAVKVRYTGDGGQNSLVLHTGANGRFRLRVTGPDLYALQAVDERSVPPRSSSEVLAEADDEQISLVVRPQP